MLFLPETEFKISSIPLTFKKNYQNDFKYNFNLELKNNQSAKKFKQMYTHNIE